MQSTIMVKVGRREIMGMFVYPISLTYSSPGISIVPRKRKFHLTFVRKTLLIREKIND